MGSSPNRCHSRFVAAKSSQFSRGAPREKRTRDSIPSRNYWLCMAVYSQSRVGLLLLDSHVLRIVSTCTPQMGRNGARGCLCGTFHEQRVTNPKCLERIPMTCSLSVCSSIRWSPQLCPSSLRFRSRQVSGKLGNNLGQVSAKPAAWRREDQALSACVIPHFQCCRTPQRRPPLATWRTGHATQLPCDQTAWLQRHASGGRRCHLQ